MIEDEMQNQWGCGLVVNHQHPGNKTFQDLDAKIRSDITSFKLHSVAVSGTTANTTALNSASQYDI